MSQQLFDALELLPATESWCAVKSRPLTLNIDIQRQPQNNVPCTPKTPCSMLSPLTPKKKKKAFLENDFSPPAFSSCYSKYRRKMLIEDEPYLMLLIDITSLLGRRLMQTFSRLNLHSNAVVRNYERLCNREEIVDESDYRVLRNLEGRMLPAYKKRICHRDNNRCYFFKASERLERRKTLLAGGLDRKSRRLLRRMKPCFLRLERIDRNGLEPVNFPSAGELLNLLSAVPVIKLTRLPAFLDQFVEPARESICLQQQKQTRVEDVDAVLAPISCPHRKSVRRRSRPKKLLDAV